MQSSQRQLDIYTKWQAEDCNILINAVAGSGKCLGKDTPVLMYDGKIKLVQDIKKGDLLMGVDSTPREVLSTTIGKETLYRINPVKGDSWICNESHILSLTGTGRKKGKIKNISVRDFLKETDNIYNKTGRRDRDWKQYRSSGIEFSEKPYNLNPYFIGLYLGDGSRNISKITLSSQVLIDWTINYIKSIGLNENLIYTETNCQEISIGSQDNIGYPKSNPVLNFAKLIGEIKFIPDEYKYTSKKVRLQVLAGLLDTDGYLCDGTIEIITKYEQLRDDILFLCRSLGLAAYSSVKSVKLENWTESRDYQRISISGNLTEIPFKHLSVSPRKQIKRVTVTGFEIENIGEGDYYGFTLDGDRLFHLGDFTITHNTTTLLELLRMCQYKTLFLAFNKSIQEEIQHKIDTRGLKQGKAMTIHSLGLSAIKQAYRRFKINNNKNWDLIKKFQEKFKRDLNRLQWNERVRLSYALMDMNDISRMFLTDEYREIKSQFLSMDKALPDVDNMEDYWLEFALLRDATYETDVVEIDFNDMIYLPVIKQLNIPINPYYLMVDECQDLNLCQHTLIDMLINQGDIHKWIAVGDRNQAIYGFSGAYSSSFDLFSQKGNVCEMPLDICYRCSTDIIDSANEVYNVMEYHKSNPGIVDKITNIGVIKENSMVICRNTGPLINLYFNLLALNKNCFIKGEDILNSIIRFIKPYNNLTVSAAITEMEYKLEDLARSESEEGKIKYYVFKENYGNFTKIVQHMCGQYETIDSFLNKLKSLFIDKEDAIMLCTIHKSKGLESDVVYILNENLIPSKFAKSAEQLKQEMNLKYVARTRAKEEMYFLDI